MYSTHPQHYSTRKCRVRRVYKRPPFSILFVIGSNWFGAGQREAAVRCSGHRGMLRRLDSNSSLAFRTIGEREIDRPPIIDYHQTQPRRYGSCALVAAGRKGTRVCCLAVFFVSVFSSAASAGAGAYLAVIEEIAGATGFYGADGRQPGQVKAGGFPLTKPSSVGTAVSSISATAAPSG